MLSADYYISDIIRATEGIKRQLAERDERIRLLTEGQNLGGYKALRAYPERNLHSGKYTTVTKETIERAYQQAEEIKTANAAIIAHNIKVRDAIVIFMESMGFKKEESYYKSIYAKKRTTNVNGWWGEVNLKIPTSDGGCENFKSYLRGLENELEKQEKDRLAAAERQKAELAFQEKEKEAHAYLIKTCIKYDLSAVNLTELRDSLMARCKYLTLAYWLEKNRGDWSDGTDFAERGLNAFYNHKDFDPDGVDTAIGAEISDLIGESWDGDGRCFRDCKFNYDELYSMADAGLYEDFQKTVNFI